MTREEAALKLSFHLMQCGMLMPLGRIDKDGEGSELFEALSGQMPKVIERYEKATGKKLGQKTNADRIRAMSDEELAVWLCGITDCSLESCPGAHLCTGGGGRANGIVEWLKQPYKEE